jgi:hypothetical protein
MNLVLQSLFLFSLVWLQWEICSVKLLERGRCVSACQCFTHSHHHGPQGCPDFKHLSMTIWFIVSFEWVSFAVPLQFSLPTVIILLTSSVYVLLWGNNRFLMSRWCLFFSVCPPFSLWTVPIFYETWYERYATWGHSDAWCFNMTQSLRTMQHTSPVVKQNWHR